MAAVVSVDQLTAAPPSVEVRSVGSLLLGNRKFMIGATIFLSLLVASIIGQLLTGPLPLRSAAFAPRLSPGAAGALLGSTSLGQSVLAQLWQAIPNSMLVGLLAATIGTVVGATLGLLSGYFGGKIDACLRVLIDVFLSVPSLLFVVLISSLFRGLGVPAIAVIIGMFAWAWPARAVRSQVLSLKERPFVQVGLLSGLSGLEIVSSELMPHLIPWLGANFINAFIAAILTETGLAILGLGSQRDMTLGQMIYWSINTYTALLQNIWWWWMAPVIALIVLFLSLYLVHLGLDEVANPRLRSQA